MVNYKEEINKLQTQLDELKSKIEKPQNKSGWYKNNYFPLWLSYYDLDKNICYGISSDGNWFNQVIVGGISKKDYLATPKEVEEALTKEAVKIGFKGNNFKCLVGCTVILNENPKFYLIESLNALYYGHEYNSNCVFKDGTWATPIKTKTIDEITSELYNKCRYGGAFYEDDFKEYLTENKQEIIETLNNL